MDVRPNTPTTGNIATPLSPLDNDNYNALDSYTLEKIAKYLKALEELEHNLNENGMHVWLNSPILVQGEGYRIGWLKPVDDFWVFVPDVKEDADVA